MVDAVTQFTNLYYDIVNLLASEPGRQFLENSTWYTSQNFFFVRLFVYVREGAIINPVFWLIIQLLSEKCVPAHNAAGYAI